MASPLSSTTFLLISLFSVLRAADDFGLVQSGVLDERNNKSSTPVITAPKGPRDIYGKIDNHHGGQIFTKRDIYGKIDNHDGGQIFTKRDIYGKIDNHDGGKIYTKRAIYGVVNNQPGGQINGVPIYPSPKPDLLSVGGPGAQVGDGAGAAGLKEIRSGFPYAQVATGLDVANFVDAIGGRHARDYYGKVDSGNAPYAAAASKSGEDYYGRFKASDHPELFN